MLPPTSITIWATLSDVLVGMDVRNSGRPFSPHWYISTAGWKLEYLRNLFQMFITLEILWLFIKHNYSAAIKGVCKGINKGSTTIKYGINKVDNKLIYSNITKSVVIQFKIDWDQAIKSLKLLRRAFEIHLIVFPNRQLWTPWVHKSSIYLISVACLVEYLVCIL